MNKEFVPYKESLELKELGFDEPCFGYHDTEGLQFGVIFWWNRESKNSLFVEAEKTNNPKISAPTFSQAFRFFRENHLIVFWYEPILKKDYTYNFFIYNEVTGEKIFVTQSRYCKEAELACLNKLIEIVKQK